MLQYWVYWLLTILTVLTEFTVFTEDLKRMNHWVTRDASHIKGNMCHGHTNKGQGHWEDKIGQSWEEDVSPSPCPGSATTLSYPPTHRLWRGFGQLPWSCKLRCQTSAFLREARVTSTAALLLHQSTAEKVFFLKVQARSLLPDILDSVNLWRKFIQKFPFGCFADVGFGIWYRLCFMSF